MVQFDDSYLQTQSMCGCVLKILAHAHKHPRYLSVCLESFIVALQTQNLFIYIFSKRLSPKNVRNLLLHGGILCKYKMAGGYLFRVYWDFHYLIGANWMPDKHNVEENKFVTIRREKKSNLNRHFSFSRNFINAHS